MRDNRSKYIIKLTALQRYMIWYPCKHIFDHIRIAEFPKSGGTWLGQMVAEMAGVHFPRNTWMSMSRGVQHSHLSGPVGKKKTILLVRDGRDVMVSAYHHFIIGHDHNPGFLTQQWRRRLQVEDVENIEKHLPRFIALFFAEFRVGGRPMNWMQHLSSFDLANPNLLLVKYEDLLVDCKMQLERIASFYDLVIDPTSLKTIIKQNSFENIANRKAGSEDKSSFLRKGIAGDWKNHFNDEAISTFNSLAQEGLRELGYE